MNKLRTIILGSLVAGSLALPTASALARVEWRDIRSDQARLLMDYDEVARARRQLDWDLDHGASGYQIQRDHTAIQNALEDVRRDRETLQRDMFDYENFS
jgi:hypothetical protein